MYFLQQLDSQDLHGRRGRLTSVDGEQERSVTIAVQVQSQLRRTRIRLLLLHLQIRLLEIRLVYRVVLLIRVFKPLLMGRCGALRVSMFRLWFEETKSSKYDYLLRSLDR
jgi:hypothetical protein